MPEGPEVHLAVEFLSNLMRNYLLQDIKILGGKYDKKGKEPQDWDKFKKALPMKVDSVKNKGKFMYICLDKYVLFITFGLTGFFSKNQSKHSHLEFKLVKTAKHVYTDKEVVRVYFTDQLKFGTIRPYKLPSSELTKKLKELGPDPLQDTSKYDFDEWRKRFTKKTNQNKAVGEVLMNQKVNAGVGNYIRAEVLYNLKWDPFRKVSSLSSKEVLELWEELKRYMKWAFQLQIKHGVHETRKYFKIYEAKDAQRDELVKKRTIYWDPKIQTKK